MPEELRPFQLQTATKQRICYGYNLAQGCSLATLGSPKQCTKGVHVCAKCHKENHSLVNLDAPVAARIWFHSFFMQAGL